MRPFLTAKHCGDPNPHGPHNWPMDPYGDEDVRHFCAGVENVPVKAALLGDPPKRKRDAFEPLERPFRLPPCRLYDPDLTEID